MSSSGDTKVALVTGSSSGIGEAIVKLFAKKGLKVVVCGSNSEKVKRVQDECAKLSAGLNEAPLALVLDFRNPDNGELAVKKTIEHYGRLDILVNNAGIFRSTPSDKPESVDKYSEVISINTDATVRATLASVAYLRQSKGNLIFISSVAASRPHGATFAYCMSKAAMSMLAKCLAIELAPDVRVNVVSPGPVRTSIMENVGLSEEMMHTTLSKATLNGRIGESEEVASLVDYLVSDDANFIVGEDIIIDGGYVLRTFSSPHSHFK